MAVENVAEQGGRMPPRVNLARISQPAPSQLNQMVMDAAQASITMKTLRDAGITPPAAVAQADDRSPKVDVGIIVKSQNDLLASLLGRITDMATSTQDAKSKAEIGKLETTVQGLVEALTKPQDNPLDTVRKNYMALVELTKEMQKSVAPATPPPLPGMDSLAAMPILLEMKKMDLEREERGRTHEITLAEMKRGWVMTDRKLSQQIDLENRRFDWEMKSSSQKSNMLGGFLSSLAQGLDMQALMKGGGVAANPAANNHGPAPRLEQDQPAPLAPQQGMVPRIITCGSCGVDIEVESPDQMEVQCPTCGQAYDLRAYLRPAAEQPEGGPQPRPMAP
jgi:hypothetical protein